MTTAELRSIPSGTLYRGTIERTGLKQTLDCRLSFLQWFERTGRNGEIVNTKTRCQIYAQTPREFTGQNATDHLRPLEAGKTIVFDIIQTDKASRPTIATNLRRTGHPTE